MQWGTVEIIARNLNQGGHVLHMVGTRGPIDDTMRQNNAKKWLSREEIIRRSCLLAPRGSTNNVFCLC